MNLTNDVRALLDLPPNRFADVRALCEQHPDAFTHDAQHDARRLALLRTVIIPWLNTHHPEDGGNWGCLTKTDQGNKVPCDELAWRTPEWTITIDCLTGTEACWTVQGVAPPAWQWTAVDAAPPDTRPGPDLSVPVWYLPTPVPLVVGTLVPQPDGQCVLIDALGQVVSVGPPTFGTSNPTIRLLPPGSVGDWELARRVGRWLRYDGSGQPVYLPVDDRPL